MISLSAPGAQFICGFEKFEPRPYQDGGGVWTIGYGAVISGPAAYPHGITEEQALVLMRLHVNQECSELGAVPELNTLLPTAQDAVISLAYNIGVGAFLESTVFTRIKYRNPDLSPWLFFVLDKKHQIEQGLVIRRRKEQLLFIYGQYS